MSSGLDCQHLNFAILPSETVFHKARGVRLRFTPDESSRTIIDSVGDVFISRLRLVFVPKHSASGQHLANPIPLGLDGLEDERISSPFWDHECIEFRYVIDEPSTPEERHLLGSYRISFVSASDHSGDTLLKVMLLLLHYLYQVRFGPVYEVKDLPTDGNLNGNPESAPPGAVESLLNAVRPTSPVCNKSSTRTAVTQAFVDPKTAEIFYVDCTYVPQRHAFLDSATNNVYLAEEVIASSAVDAAPKHHHRQYSDKDLRRTIQQMKALAKRR